MLWYIVGSILIIFLITGLYVLCEDTKHNYQKTLLEYELIKYYHIKPEDIIKKNDEEH